MALNLAVALGTVLVFAGRQPPVVLGIWFLIMLLTLALRLHGWRQFRRAPPESIPAPAWARRFTLGAAATGAGWGLAGVLFYAPHSWVAQVYLPFVMAGMVGGSVTALTGHMPAYVAFSVCTLVPFALRLAAEGDLHHLVMATLVVLYLIGMGVLGRNVSASLSASVRLAAENQDLVSALQEKSAQLEATFDHVNQGVAVFDRDGRLVTWNPHHRELHGYPAELYRRGTHLKEFLRHDLARDTAGHRDGSADQRLRRLSRHPAPARFEQVGAAGRVLEVERNPMPGGGFVSTSTDFTARKRTEARMLHLAQHDSLTGLPNRLLFHDRLHQAMARHRRDGGLLAVVMLDLDRFKQVNDAFGHRVGDDVLKRVGERMRAALRESDTVARIGGDEFALILPDLPDADAAALIADKIASQLDRPFELDAGVWQPRASLGIALFPGDGQSVEQLLRNADLAMYRAKAGGGGAQLFAATIKRDFDRRQHLKRELVRAIARGQLTLEYQPQLDLEPERVSGIEALLRWHHPDFGTIRPETLIELAEASGQIAAIGEWALREACAVAAGLPRAEPPLRLAVNVSASQMASPELVALVKRALADSGLAAERLELELTESAMLRHLEQVMTTLELLHDMGVALALDDFGTGYASLSHLKSFPLDRLKVDRTFVANLADDRDAAIVRSLIELGHRLGLRVVAEGVESEAQLKALRRLGCDTVQGHAVGHPLSAVELGRWLSARA
ncbi:MAG TPA: EAL domain-containing protein [Geminicoccaceae bacterium]|nr:EAL domain-containing protein [Geminicoccaceae bacterium]